MILARVCGEVVSTIQHPVCHARRMLVVERLDQAGRDTGKYLVAFAGVGAGVGETVLVIDEGNSARQVIDDKQAPIRSIIVGIVDDISTVSS